MNNRGALGNQLAVLPYFVLLFIVTGVIVAGFYIVFGQGYDVRASEAQELHSLVSTCISKGSIDWSIPESFFARCGLSKQALEQHPFLIRICEGSCQGGTKPLFFVNSNYQACDFKETRSREYPRCVTSMIVIKGKQYELIAGSSVSPRRSA